MVSDPNNTGKPIRDTPEAWAELFDNPDIVADDNGKRNASVVCGAKYFPEVDNRDKEGVEGVTCLVLDVDDPGPPEDALRSSLAGTRSIVVTSASHTKEDPKWRVLLPLAHMLPPKKHRSLVRKLSDELVPGYEGCINVDATGDPTRLGFVGVTKHPEDYRWFSIEGERFDWTQLLLEDEQWLRAPLGGLDRKPHWTKPDVALQLALRHFATTGHDGVLGGEHRTIILYNAALNLWWQWAAEDEAFVLQVLHHINAQFPQAKDEEVLIRKMREAHARSIGPERKEQLIGPYGMRREPGNTASVATIKHHARRLKRSHRGDHARLGDELSRLADGLTVADEPAVWSSALARCAHELASTFVHDTREKLASFFLTSLGAMAKKGPVPDIQTIEAWIGTRLEGEKKRRADNARRNADTVKSSISFATGGLRDTPYTPEEIDLWQSPNGVGLNDKTWLLVSGNGTFVFLDGTWNGPYTETEFDAQAYTDLEAASPYVRFKIFNEEKGTTTFVKRNHLLQKYGGYCQTRVDFSCDRTWFRMEDKTLMLAGPKKNTLEPRFHTEVDQWLRVMTGRSEPANEKVRQGEARDTNGMPDDYDAICSWLACVIQLEHVCAALYLQGPKSVGKGLFADGVAKIWKNGKIPLNAAFGKFNAMLAERALIHVDEGLPSGMTATVLLRKTLADTEHLYERKHKDHGTVTGCVRMLFTANNLDLFNASKEKLQKDDVDALADRFVHIKVRPEAAEFLKSLGPKHHDFVKRNMLAEHTLWLNEARWPAIKRQDLRFLVEGRNANVSNVVATNTDSTSDVCNALAEALAEKKPGDFFAVKNGLLWVSVPALWKHFSGLNGIGSKRTQYPEREIARAVGSVSTRRQAIRVIRSARAGFGGFNGSGGAGSVPAIHGVPTQQKMWCFRLDALQAWCENTNVYDWNDVVEGLNALNQNEEV